MGCDIHAYIDYDVTYKGSGEKRTQTYQWAHPEFHREYSLFALMAGGLRDERQAEDAYPVRGPPERVAFSTLEEYTLYVSDRYANEEGYCSKERAIKWTTPYPDGSPWAGQSTSVWMNKEHTRVSRPDWHTASWLTPAEFEDCVTKFNKRFTASGPVQPCVDAILAAMKALEARDLTVRLVFWFDN